MNVSEAAGEGFSNASHTSHLTTKRARGPASRREEVSSADADYHLPVLGQPPLPDLSQARVTVPCVLVIENLVPSEPFEVTERV